MPSSPNLIRRRLLAAGGLASTGALLSINANAQGKAKVGMQLGWIAGGNQILVGVLRALRDVETALANLDAEVGQVSSSPSNMLAVSQDLPIQVFATGLQQHPYTFFSLKKNPIRTPKDMVGKKIGIQSTGMVLLRALLAKNKIDEKAMTIIPIGSDMTPLLTGQVDTVTGWLTNTSALKPLGADRVDMRLWDTGVHLYALPYYAHVDTIRQRPELLQRFLRATARGWAYANKNRDQAVDLLIKEYPNLNGPDERIAVDSLMSFAYNDLTNKGGWGTMDKAVWQEQIKQYADLGQFTKRVPKVEEVMTMDILNATREYRVRNS